MNAGTGQQYDFGDKLGNLEKVSTFVRFDMRNSMTSEI